MRLIEPFELDYRPAHYRIKDLRRRTRVVRQVGCCSSKSVGAVRQWFGRITPCTAVVGGCRPEQHRALEYGHFAVGFCGAGQHHFVRVDNRVACDDGSRRGRRVDGHVQRARGRAGIAGSISCRGRQAVAAIRQDRRGVAPGPCSARQRAAEQRRTVIDLDRAASLRRAG